MSKVNPYCRKPLTLGLEVPMELVHLDTHLYVEELVLFLRQAWL